MGGRAGNVEEERFFFVDFVLSGCCMFTNDTSGRIWSIFANLPAGDFLSRSRCDGEGSKAAGVKANVAQLCLVS